MFWRILPIVVLMLTLAAVGYLHFFGVTKYAAAFDRRKFSALELSGSVDEAWQAIGVPLRATVIFTGDQVQRPGIGVSPLTKERLVECCQMPDGRVILYYSTKAYPVLRYEEHTLIYVKGKLANKTELFTYD